MANFKGNEMFVHISH